MKLDAPVPIALSVMIQLRCRVLRGCWPDGLSKLCPTDAAYLDALKFGLF